MVIVKGKQFIDFKRGKMAKNSKIKSLGMRLAEADNIYFLTEDSANKAISQFSSFNPLSKRNRDDILDTIWMGIEVFDLIVGGNMFGQYPIIHKHKQELLPLPSAQDIIRGQVHRHG